MDSSRMTRWLGVALVVSISLNIAAWGPKARPNFEYLPDMARTPRFNAFEANPNFADGATLRVPVPGTIPRGLPPLTEEERASLQNPFSGEDRPAAERGAKVFAYFCQPCHDAKALGQGPAVKRGFPPPPPLARGQTQGKTDAQLFQIVSNGINTMPGYALQLSREDRWKVIFHVRSFRRPASP